MPCNNSKVLAKYDLADLQKLRLLIIKSLHINMIFSFLRLLALICPSLFCRAGHTLVHSYAYVNLCMPADCIYENYFYVLV